MALFNIAARSSNPTQKAPTKPLVQYLFPKYQEFDQKLKGAVQSLPEEAAKFWGGETVAQNPLVPQQIKKPLENTMKYTVKPFATSLFKGVAAPSSDKPALEKAGDIASTVGTYGMGAAAPFKNIGGGVFGVGANAVMNLFNNKPLAENAPKSFEEGFDFTAKLNTVEKLAGFILNPAIKKFVSPVEVQNANTYFNLWKNAPDEFKKQAGMLALKRIAQNIGSAAIKGGVGMGAIGAMEPAKDIKERVEHTVKKGSEGALFAGGLKGAGYGTQLFGEQVLKPFLEKLKDQRGSVQIPGHVPETEKQASLLMSEKELSATTEIRGGTSPQDLMKQGYSVREVQNAVNRNKGLGLLADFDNANEAKQPDLAASIAQKILQQPEGSPYDTYKSAMQRFAPTAAPSIPKLDNLAKGLEQAQDSSGKASSESAPLYGYEKSGLRPFDSFEEKAEMASMSPGDRGKYMVVKGVMQGKEVPGYGATDALFGTTPKINDPFQGGYTDLNAPLVNPFKRELSPEDYFKQAAEQGASGGIPPLPAELSNRMTVARNKVATASSDVQRENMMKEYGKAMDEVQNYYKNGGDMPLEEIKKVADNLERYNPGIARTEAEAMARDVIKNREFNTGQKGSIDFGATIKNPFQRELSPDSYFKQAEQQGMPGGAPPTPPGVAGMDDIQRAVQQGKLSMDEASNLNPEFQQTPIQKIVTALNAAEPIRGKQEALYSAERSRRVAQVAAMGEKVPGEAGFHAQLGQLKGELPKAQFEGVRNQLTQQDVDSLFNQVEKSNLSTFEKITAKNGLAKLLVAEGGTVPTKGEIGLLGEVFPQEFVDTVLNKQTGMQKVMANAGEAINLPRAIMATGDLSAPLRQGVFLIGRPKQWIPAFRDMFKYAFSEDAYQGLQDDIQARPTYPLMREYNLGITNMDNPSLTGREEAFMSNLGEKIPVFGPVARGSNRAYAGFLTKLRADTFDDLLKSAQESGAVNVNESGVLSDPKVVSDIASFVNNATGRGNLGEIPLFGSALQKSQVALNGALFSPRLMASRLNLLNPVYYTQLDPFVRKEALKSLLTFGGTALTIAGLSKLAGADVGTDPRSADFGKIKVGDTRYDPWGGFQQYIVAASRLLSGQMVSSTTGREFNLGEGYKPTTRMDIIKRFFESKESPIASFVTSLLEGKTATGEDVKLPVEIIDRFIPMVWQDTFDLMKERGLAGLPMSLPALFGVGVQTYGDQIPMVTKTPSGKPTVKYRQAPGLGETLFNKVTGTETTNVPDEFQQPLAEAKLEDLKSQAEIDKAKKIVLETGKPMQVGDTIVYLQNGIVKTKGSGKSQLDVLEKRVQQKVGRK